MRELGLSIEELPEAYPHSDTKELDQWVRALSRGWVSKNLFESVSPSSERKEVGESLKRLYSRGYLTNTEVQDTIKLFGGW
jgi:hypothetical protein